MHVKIFSYNASKGETFNKFIKGEKLLWNNLINEHFPKDCKIDIASNDNIEIRDEDEDINQDLNTALKAKDDKKKLTNNFHVKSISKSTKDSSKSKQEEPLILKSLLPELPEQDKKLIEKSLKSHYLFFNLSPSALEEILKEVIIFRFSQNLLIYSYGDEGYFFFIVKKGKLEMDKDIEFVKGAIQDNRTLSRGDCFGEESFLGMINRTHTVVANDKGELFALNANTCRKILYELNRVNYNEKLKLFEKISFFKWFTGYERSCVFDSLTKCQFPVGERLCLINHHVDSLYFIIKGNVCFFNGNGNNVFTMNPLGYFGLIELIFNIGYLFTAVTKTDVTCYKILTSDLNKILGPEFTNKYTRALAHEALSKTKHFKFLLSNVDDTFNKMMNDFELEKFYRGEILIPASPSPNDMTATSGKVWNHMNKDYSQIDIVGGNNISCIDHLSRRESKINFPMRERNKKLIIILSGEVIYDSLQTKVAGKLDVVCEDYLLDKNYKIPSNIIAGTDIVLAMVAKINNIVITIEANLHNELSNNSFLNKSENKKIVKEISYLLNFYELIQYLKSIPIFKSISDSKLLAIGKMMESKKFLKGDTIIKQGGEGTHLFLLYKGKVKVLDSKGKKIRTIQDPIILGEISVLYNKPQTATVIAEEDSELYKISKENFIKIYDESMVDYFANRKKLYDNEKLELNNLFHIKSLGEGKFGNVSLVHDGQSLFAIKAVRKKLANKQKKLSSYFVKEREILLSIDHPFIIKLAKTFINEDYVFYLMEFANGEDLAKYLSSKKQNTRRNKEETQFYIASLFLVLNYLHEKSIVHRDIKAENVVFDEKGYIKLIDFNTCVKIRELDLTNTITGTPNYMAPEILIGGGYSFPVDYWSVGILAYLIYFGTFPFGQGLTDPLRIYSEITQKNLAIPHNTDDSFSNFLRRILEKTPSKRLCSLEAIKNEEFFQRFSWDDLIDMKMDPPFIPTPKMDVNQCVKEGKTQYTEYLKQNAEKNISYSMNETPNTPLQGWDNNF